jgi:hypothetical protein
LLGQAQLRDSLAAQRNADAQALPQNSAAVELARRLTEKAYDCVVIGGGVRVPPKRLQLFEQLVNVVHASAPHASIAFNTRPDDTADAAARWLGDH